MLRFTTPRNAFPKHSLPAETSSSAGTRGVTLLRGVTGHFLKMRQAPREQAATWVSFFSGYSCDDSCNTKLPRRERLFCSSGGQDPLKQARWSLSLPSNAGLRHNCQAREALPSSLPSQVHSTLSSHYYPEPLGFPLLLMLVFSFEFIFLSPFLV